MEGLCRGWGKVEIDQTGTCLALHKMQYPEQAPVWHYTKCRDLNSCLFTLSQTAWPQTGACLLSRRLRGPKQAPVYSRASRSEPNRYLFSFAQASAEAEEVYPGTRPSFPAPAGALFGFPNCCALRMVSWCAKGDLGGAERDCCRAEAR